MRTILEEYKEDDVVVHPMFPIRKSLVDKFENSDVFLRWIPDKYNQIKEKWNETFLYNELSKILNNMSKTEKLLRASTNYTRFEKSENKEDRAKKYLKVLIKNYPWYIYEGKLVDAYCGIKAEEELDNDNRNLAYCFLYIPVVYDDYKVQVYEIKGNLKSDLLREMAREFKWEFFIFNENENWTLIYTHNGTAYYHIGN